MRRPGPQPAGVTNGAPPTVENNARTVRAVTPTATPPIKASDAPVRTGARPHARKSSSTDPTTSTTSNAVPVRSPKPIFSVSFAEGPTSSPTVRVITYAAIVSALTTTLAQYRRRDGAAMTSSAQISSNRPTVTK